MLNFGNKEFRNLQEQVLYLSQKIAGVNSGVKGRVDNVPALGDLKDAKIGDMYLVGTEYPYYFYVKTTETEWTNLGTMASTVPGPKGDRGVQGIQGVDGSIIYIQSKPQDAPEGSISIDLDSSLYSYQNGKWTLKTNLKGPMGPTGLRGPQGETGPQGPQGEKGDKGDAGTSIKIGGVVASENLLPAKPVNGENAYLVGTSAPYLLYVWVNNGWLNAGPVVGNTTPNTSEARSQPLNNLKIGNNVYGNDLGLVTETGEALWNKLHEAIYGTNMTMHNVVTFETEGAIDTTELMQVGSKIAYASGDANIYVISEGKNYYFKDDGSAVEIGGGGGGTPIIEGSPDIRYTSQDFENVKKGGCFYNNTFFKTLYSFDRVTYGDTTCTVFYQLWSYSDNLPPSIYLESFQMKKEGGSVSPRVLIGGYLINSLNNEAVDKVLICNKNKFSWAVRKQYFNHDIVITFNNEKLVLNLVSSSNTPIDSITDIKTAYGSRTTVEMNGMFQDDDVMREAVYYNVQTNKIATYIPSTGVFKEIMLATYTDTDQRDYTLGTIVDDVTLI